MAGDWIKMRAALTSCPKVMAMVRTVGCENEEFKGLSRDTLRLIVVGGLHAVWSAVNEHSTDGVLQGLYIEDIDDMAGVTGFGEAMESVGWLVADQKARTLSFPNFTQWNIPGKDTTAAERMRKHREKQRVTRNVTRNVAQPLRNVTRNALQDVTRNAVTVTRNRYDRQDKTRERQEGEVPGNDETPNGVSSSDGFATVPAASPSPDLGNAPERPQEAPSRPKRAKRVYRVTWDANAGFKGITEADQENWKSAYPAVDIRRAFAAMHAWLIANPAKAKKSNWQAFITRWLQREQDRGGDAKSNPVNRAISHEERRNAQSLADQKARDAYDYRWREDARKMMGAREYAQWRAAYEREMKRRRAERDDSDDGNEFLKIRRPPA